VRAFATEQGVDAYLPAVLAMTQREFPDARRIELGVETDPDMPDDRHLLVRVEVTEMDGEAFADAKFRWGRELFQLCPAPLVCVFRCALRVVGP
jgi:hypothetical protein